MTEFDWATLEHRLRELAFLNSGVRIVLADKRHAVEKREEMVLRGRRRGVREIPRSQQDRRWFPKPIVIKSERDGIVVECALWWNDGYHETVLCFTNNIPQRDGGTHLAGFRGALTRQVTGYAESGAVAKKEKVALTGDDCREGLTAVLSVKVPDPKFSSQTKDKLVSSEVRPVVEGVLNDALAAWLEEHPGEAKIDRRQGHPGGGGTRGGAQGARDHRARARSAWRRFPASSPTARSAIRPSPNCSSSRATRPAAPPSRAATASSRLCCRCAARSSTSNARAWTRCCRARKSAR